jgi:hypothetical protein
MPSGSLGVSHIPRYGVPLDHRDSCGQVCFVSREAAAVLPEFLPLSGDSPQLTERIKAFELQPTVIAEKLMQPGKPENNQGIVVTTLNAGAFTSGTPHTLAILSIPRIRGAIICGGGEKREAGAVQVNLRGNINLVRSTRNLGRTLWETDIFQQGRRESPVRPDWRGRRLDARKPAERYVRRALLNNPGGFLLSHAVARAVPSAPRGLTSVFGMGTGVTLSTQPPENCFDLYFKFEI